jgi:hypothetical protein
MKVGNGAASDGLPLRSFRGLRGAGAGRRVPAGSSPKFGEIRQRGKMWNHFVVHRIAGMDTGGFA